jgi:DNA-binding response OmpR family regulator
VQTSPKLVKTTLSIGPVMLDLLTRQVQVGGQVVELSAREFILTETFMRHAGQVLSREQLLDLAWGYGYDPGSNIVDVYVGYLRKKLGSDCIETVRGMGYRMVPSEVINAAVS